jgi:nitrite reductase/ring-hydroxylating ferredoxin subunit
VHSTRTHNAGFERNVERTFRQIFAIQVIGGGRDGNDLGVGGYIAQLLGLIVRPGNDLIFADDNCTHWDLSFFKRKFRLLECLFHKVVIAMDREHKNE